MPVAFSTVSSAIISFVVFTLHARKIPPVAAKKLVLLVDRKYGSGQDFRDLEKTGQVHVTMSPCQQVTLHMSVLLWEYYK